MRRSLPLLLLGLLCLSVPLLADGPAFDLAGPKVDVHVKRGELTLPIGQVANLLPVARRETSSLNRPLLQVET